MKTGAVFLLLFFLSTVTHARFLQTDPVGYQDQMNLYAYVANDPFNNTDPSGKAKCSSSLSKEQCNTALDAADAAKDAAEKASTGLSKLAEKVKDGVELTEGEQGALDAVSEKFGDKFTSAKGLKQLAKGLKKSAAKIGERGSGATLRHGGNTGPLGGKDKVPAGYVMSSFGGTNSIYLNDKYFNYKYDRTREYVMLHEAAHLMGAWRDRYIRGGVNPLFNNANPFAGAMKNADTFACHVYPMSCGY